MKLYKVISAQLKAKDGGKFSYKDYLPKNNKKGKWTPIIEDIEEYVSGYHVTPYWNMFIDDENNKVFEVEVKGLQETNTVGVADKYVCKSIRLVKEIQIKINSSSTGIMNTGDRNTGTMNTGTMNTGNRNTGHKNSGDMNTGIRNSGDMNTGIRNSGGMNTGNCNTGNWNTGDENSGFLNSGHKNTGNCNTGDWNTGYRNTGSWNSGHRHTGFFNTMSPQIILVFNKECSLLEWEKAIIPQFIYFNLIENDYKKSFIESFNKTTKGDVELLLKLPNFDYEVFEEISGISKKMIEEKLK